MNNNSRVPSLFRISFVSIALSLFLSLAASAADKDSVDETSPFKGAIPEKDTPFPKVSRDLLQLQQEFQTYDTQRSKMAKVDPFTPHVKLMRTSGDYVVVDAIAAGDAAALQADLLGIGAVNVSTNQLMV